MQYNSKILIFEPPFNIYWPWHIRLQAHREYVQDAKNEGLDKGSENH